MNLGTETDLQPVPFRYFLDETGRGEGGQGDGGWWGKPVAFTAMQNDTCDRRTEAR